MAPGRLERHASHGRVPQDAELLEAQDGAQGLKVIEDSIQRHLLERESLGSTVAAHVQEVELKALPE